MAKAKSRNEKQSRRTSSFQDQTSLYAQRVIDGDIVAGKFVRLACERHFSDLEAGGERGIYFDVEAAERAIRFFPSMFTIADDPDENPFALLDWHKFVVGSLFGWHKDGRLRFREVFVETGKGQAKSPLMGGIALYVAGFMGIPHAQCYAISSDMDQAKVVLHDAVSVCRAPIPGKEGQTLEGNENIPGMVFISGKGRNAWRIEFRDSGGFFEAKATTDRLSGPRPDAVFADEVHEFRTSKPIDLWKAGVNKKKGSAFLFMATNTPGADQTVCTEISARYQGLLEGNAEDDTCFGFIARVDVDDNPFADENCWIKALPALGKTFPVENVRAQVNQAKVDASARLTVSRLFFGIPIGSAGFWVDETSWRHCLGRIDPDNRKPCYLGVDLSDTNDLTALSAVWRDENDNLQSKVWYWTTSQGIERRSALDRINYRAYVDKGELTIVDGPVIDYRFVAERIRELMSEYNVQCLAIDPNYNLSRFLDDCEDAGLPVWMYEGPEKPAGKGLKIVRHEQGGKVPFGGRKLCMPHSMERFKNKVLAGEIVIEKNRLTEYCAANAGTELNSSGQSYFIKTRQMGRIDGIVAMTMAVGASDGVKSDAPKKSYMSSGVFIT